MSNDSFTLGAMVEDIFSSYKRERPDIRARLPNRLAYWISQLATRYPFWFMVVEPGALVPGLFPFTDPPTYTEYAESAWIDAGWLHSAQGQRDYYFSAPADETRVTELAQWTRLRVQNIEAVMQWPLAGGPPREIQPKEATEFLRSGNWTTSQGEPDCCTLINIGTNSLLRFNRTHDSNKYIYSVRFVRKEFPVFTSPSDTNSVFQYQPEFVRVLGCWIVANEFRDQEAAADYYDQLYGSVNPMTGRRDGGSGLLSLMVQETRKRWSSQDQVLEHYTSPPIAHQSYGRRVGTDGYYPDYGM